jgi:two-component system sensor histidine kinase DesK
MHDLTGQSLSMITLKSELTARIIERLPPSPDRDRAVDEIGQIAAVSRQTLHDIRQAVSGYRRPTLAVEVITARNALESARITPHDDSQVTLASGTFDPEAEAALAWCLREAVTNVVRHSGAQNCHISLTKRTRTIALEIRDDGRCLGPADEADESAVQVPIATSTAPSCGPDWPGGGTIGTGLHGMSERLAAVGGTLELRPGVGGFTLIATVPADDRSGRPVDRVTLTS